MVQSKRIIQALKGVLKERRVSYEQVAGHLGLSLSSVKRLFSTGGFTLERVESICDLAGVDILELARQGEAQRLQVASLTEEHERELIGDPALLLVAICALNRWRFGRILQHYQLSEPRLIQLLARLDRMGLIELLPGNRIKLRVARNFAWLPDGPIHRYFVDHVQNAFLSVAVRARPRSSPFRVGNAVGRVGNRAPGEDGRTHGDLRRADPRRRSSTKPGRPHLWQLPLGGVASMGTRGVPGDAAHGVGHVGRTRACPTGSSHRVGRAKTHPAKWKMRTANMGIDRQPGSVGIRAMSVL